VGTIRGNEANLGNAIKIGMNKNAGFDSGEWKVLVEKNGSL